LNYYYYFVPENRPSIKFIASVLLIAALIAAMFRLRKAQPVLSFAMAWFFITLAPALSINNVSGMVFAERYDFIPSLGFCIFGAWAWLALTQDRSSRAVLSACAYSFAFLLLAFYIVQIERRLPSWHDDLRLLEDAAQQSPYSSDVQMQLGATYYRAERYNLAVTHLDRAIGLGRADYQPHIFLALSLAPLGRYDEANAELLKAYQLRPARVPNWPVYGLAHAGLHQWDQAAECYTKAIEQNPSSQLMFELLGETLQEKGDIRGAMDAWQHALNLQPGYLDASINLAVAAAEAGNTDQAVSLLTSAVQANPKEQHVDDAYVNLGTVYLHRGEWDAAEAAYQQALNLNPDQAFARRSIDMIETRRHSQPVQP
jgi:tetratricopeptide (TPR) repeat protein